MDRRVGPNRQQETTGNRSFFTLDPIATEIAVDGDQLADVLAAVDAAISARLADDVSAERAS
jgi:hypothetical protein